MRAPLPRPTHPRRGVTLVEMLVVVALVILMMVILVQIFQQATGAMSASKATQELDVVLRQVDLRLKQDLAGATARFTPPLDPAQNLGYFEYGENAFADLQGEDTDDYIAFTTKAPEGQVFTGRAYVLNSVGVNGPITGVAGNTAVQPVTITSQLAEVIYFLRNGNLYRRVFLILPDRASSSLSNGNNNPFPALGASNVSWLGVNDLSARPPSTGLQTVTLNGSGIAVQVTSPALANNSHPPAYPILNSLGDLTNRENRAFRPRFRSDFTGGLNNGPDGIDDDANGDDIPDFYPTLYPDVFNTTLVNEYLSNGNRGSGYRLFLGSNDVYGFPYIYPGMYSHPDPNSLASGWIHSLDPTHATFNHAPLAIGDNLTIPSAAGQAQTWWGFPTWRETLSPYWGDPLLGLGDSEFPNRQSLGLNPFPANAIPTANSSTFLPPVPRQYGNDGAGNSAPHSFATFVGQPGVWDDDLVLTNVRSFDVKAYDLDAPLYINAGSNFLPSGGYYDLGYGAQGNTQFLSATPTTLWGPDSQPQGFGHAGRMPPAVNDHRLNPSRPLVNGINNFVGDDGTNGPVTRLTRVWDSWSTDYTNAPDVDINLNGYPGGVHPNPVYPSYPAPYTSPLRGIQIQIRVADPRGEHVKVLTIRQDFTDKL